MEIKSRIQTGILVVGSAFILGCSSSAEKQEKPMAKMPMTYGNAKNVTVIKNPTMMFHDITVNSTNEGAELEGKIHVMARQNFIPGHIDIAVIDKQTGENISTISTDFNSRVARHGRYNLKHPNNIGTRLPGVDPEKSTIVVAYHYSNVDRLSVVDCGANVALASFNSRENNVGKNSAQENNSSLESSTTEKSSAASN